LLDTGPRVSEFAGFTRNNIDWQTYRLMIYGKGGPYCGKTKRRNVLRDTGCGITIVSKEIVQNLGLEVAEGRLIHLKTIAADVHASLARLDSIQLGSLSSIDFPVAVADLTLGERNKA
jgi:hypothetical protein